MQKTIMASEFKAKCLKLMDEVAATGDVLTVTKNGKPVVEIRPVIEKPASIYGALKGSVTIIGDIVSPVEEDWEEATLEDWDDPAR